MDKAGQITKLDDSKVIRISQELIDVLEKIKHNVEKYTWGAEDNIGYCKASKILALKIKRANLY